MSLELSQFSNNFTEGNTRKLAGNGRVHALDCIMGNQGDMVGNSKVVMEIQAKYTVHDSSL